MAATASTNPGKHRTTCTQGRRGPMQQTELFGDERPGALVGTPAWRDLPAATQAVLTSLVAQLILDHAETCRHGPTAGVVHDL